MAHDTEETVQESLPFDLTWGNFWLAFNFINYLWKNIRG